tara:strand:+ start:1644 stop:2237 length:594 start_codon:yes stop_codon:yes gene_type:complete
MSPKQLWLLAGGNGAGKSTFYFRFLQPKGVTFVNADLIAKERWPDDPEGKSYEASKVAEILREQLLREGANFCFETVFSHRSKIDFVAEAKALGYEINLVFIHLESADLNIARISERVTEGGHNVPCEKVIARIERALVHVCQAIALCDVVMVLDNSSLDNPFKKVAQVKGGEVMIFQDPLPDWANTLLRPRIKVIK